MEVEQGPNWGCSAKEKENMLSYQGAMIKLLLKI
jgi:hypothetical protein